jgi:hypothetical protein
MLQNRRARLTDSLVQGLKPAESGMSYRVADAEQAGLFVIVGRRTKAFTAQADVRQNGRRARTVKRVLGHSPEMPTRAARAGAREFLGKIARGEDPDACKQTPAGLTMAKAWALYENEHLRRLGRSELTIANYRFHIEHHLRDWSDISLTDLAREPRRAADMHTLITQTAGPAQANGVMRTLRILYRFARRQAPGQLPPECPTQAITFHPEKRRDTAMGMDELAGWWQQLQALKNPIRIEFHLLTLLSGSRPGALKVARWEELNVKHRVLHVPSPKGGAQRSFEIPLSNAMLRCLWRVRKAGRALHPKPASEWIFPASSRQGHIVEHKQARATLSHWGGDLRQTFRTIAQAIGISELDVRLLMNHMVSDVSAEYITRSVLVRTSLRVAQQRLSQALTQLMKSR